MYNMTDITTLYVSQKNGDDRHQGLFPYSNETLTGPLKTVEAALQRAADLRLAGVKQPLTICVMDEIYNVEKPIMIGNDVSDITLEPFTHTLLSGGIQITDFKEDVFNGKKCISADVSGLGELAFTDFYVNGKRADFTRYPQEGTLRPEEVENNSSELFAHSRWFVARKEDLETIKSFRNFEDCFISYNHYWIDEHTPIEDYDMESGKITFKYPSRFTIEPTHEASALRYIIENTAENFCNPNEWYYDRPAGKVYYIPEDDSVQPEQITAYIPVTDKIFCIAGTPDHKVRNIRIRNFEIAYTRGDYRSLSPSNHPEDIVTPDGFASDMQAVCAAPGSVEFTHASHCALENCRLYCLGVHAVVAEEGSRNLRITGNEISQIGAGGLRVNGGEAGTEEALHTCGNVIENNVITNCGLRYFSACGILLMHSYDNVISHNTISWLYYTGISCGWNWGYGENISRDNLIEKNHIHHIGQGKLSDMGGVYLLGKQPGTVVRNNLIHDVESCHYGGWALYTDEGSSYILLENNVCYNVSCNGFHQHYGQMNTVRNNIFAFSKETPIKLSRPEMHTGAVFERNIIVTDGTPVYATGYNEEMAGCIQLLSANHNLISDISGKEPVLCSVGGRDYTLEQMQNKFGKDIGSVILNPEFRNIEEYDFTLPVEGAAVKAGFAPIDYSDCGACK